MDRVSGDSTAVILAAIDIGTNTVLLLVAEVDTQGVIHPLEHQQRLPRLGKDVDRTGSISAASFDRIAWILNEYKNLALQLHAQQILACGTSAVRDAANRREFLSFLSTTAGIKVEILSGDEEAHLTYRGAMSGISTGVPSVVLDIGGGSTEITFPHPGGHNGDTKLQRYSLQIGSVRLTERFFKHDPPLPSELESARNLILEELSQIRNPGFREIPLVGVAGTVTTLACLDQGLDEFDVEKVSGYTLSAARVEYWAARLCLLRGEEILGLSAAAEGRFDILTAGAVVLNEIMRHFSFREIISSERGLRYGMIMREWERSQ